MVHLEIKDKLAWLWLSRSEKHNAMNEELLDAMNSALVHALENPEVHALILAAHGRFFSAGADLKSMQEAGKLARKANEAQAQQLANLLLTWHQSPKPTLCLVQGPAYGGALGFIAASDYVIATPQANFCFSEAKLGLIPAVISPYILETLGYKTTKHLFLSAASFDVHQAHSFGLVDSIVPLEDLETKAQSYAQQWLNYPRATLACIKDWLQEIKFEKPSPKLSQKTAKKLAEIRMSPEAQEGLIHFLQKKQK